MIHLYRYQRIVVRRRDLSQRIRTWNRRKLRDCAGGNNTVLPLTKALEGTEIEEPVSLNRSANRPAEFLTLELRLVECPLRLEEVLRPRIVVAEVPERRTTQCVRPRFGDDVHDAADGPAALRSPAVLKHLKFLDGFVGEVLK